LSANKETKFYPKGYSHKYRNDKGQFQCIHYVEFNDVTDWMQRCVDDWEPLPTVWDYYVEYHRLLDWRNKWFK